MRGRLDPRMAFVIGLAAVVLLAQVRWTTAAPAAVPAAAAGLTVTFAGDGPVVDARDARLVALAVPAGASPSPVLAAGPFVATWTGWVATPRHIKESYRFTAEGTGRLTVAVNDATVLDVTGDLSAHPSGLVTLHKAKNRLTVTYRPPAGGPASVRLLWARDDHPDAFDPVPPTVFTHDSADAVLVQHGRVRLGRALLVTMRCAACHAGVTGAVPELKQDAPDLTGIAARLRPAWLAAWVADPRSLRPTASMPRVLRDPAAVADVAAYLSAGAQADEPLPAADTAKGGRLFTGLGCVACHVAPGLDDADPSLNRVPLKFVAAKFRPAALAAFLRAPEAHYAWVKMPNFHLSEAEAADLTGWLLSRAKADAVPAAAAGDPERGKAVFASAGCVNCHTATGVASARDLSHADWSRGCTQVAYGFTAEQADALRAVAATDWKPALARDPAADFAARQMAAVRCDACHKIDGRDSDWSNLDGEAAAIEAALPPRAADDPAPAGDQSPPPLTWAGEKLRPGWAAAFIGGRVATKPRPWLAARMPAFASRADGLAAGLAEQHGCPSVDEPRPPADPALAEVGRGLTGQTSFGCVKCHAVGAQAAVAPFGAFAPNFAGVSERLRHDYFRRWMRNPQVYLPGTKMPTFGDAAGRTPYKDVLGGDAAAEYGAIWQYLAAGDRIVPAS